MKCKFCKKKISIWKWFDKAGACDYCFKASNIIMEEKWRHDDEEDTRRFEKKVKEHMKYVISKYSED